MLSILNCAQMKEEFEMAVEKRAFNYWLNERLGEAVLETELHLEIAGDVVLWNDKSVYQLPPSVLKRMLQKLGYEVCVYTDSMSISGWAN